MASIPTAPPDEDDWSYQVSPAVHAEQLHALSRVVGLGCVVIGGGGATWGGVLTASSRLALACYVCAALLVLAGLVLTVRVPEPTVSGRDALAQATDDTAADLRIDGLSHELLRARPVLGRVAIVGAFLGAGLLAAGAATQRTSEPNLPGPGPACLGGLCAPLPSGPASAVPSP